ncbi:MAG: hypothetical protein V4492_07065 [Chlamydiota bacterium]
MEGPKEPLLIGRAAFAKVLCVEWLTNHGKTILLSIATLIVATFSLYQIYNRIGSGARSGHFEAERAYQAWISKESGDAAQFQKVERALKGHPELKIKFGTQIAQRLVALGEVGKGSEYARAALHRTHDLSAGYYELFSKISLLVASGKYETALKASEEMKIQMEGDESFWQSRDPLIHSGSALYAYNLVRIASLYQELGQKEKELAAWDELVSNAGWKGIPQDAKTFDPEAYTQLLQNFTLGDVSLLDYIEKRKSA